MADPFNIIDYILSHFVHSTSFRFIFFVLCLFRLIALCCGMVHCVVLQYGSSRWRCVAIWYVALALCCNMVHCVALCCNMVRCVVLCCNMVRCVAVVLHCVVVCIMLGYAVLCNVCLLCYVMLIALRRIICYCRASILKPKNDTSWKFNQSRLLTEKDGPQIRIHHFKKSQLASRLYQFSCVCE